MSRTPIREAIRQMEMEGFVEYVPRFGAVVRTPDRDELAEMYTVREALESYAAAEAASRISDEELARLDDLLRRMEEIADAFQSGSEPYLEGDRLQRFLGIDLEFHRTIVRASGNRYMAKILEGTCLLARVFRSTFWVYTRQTIAEANELHGRLLNALRRRNPEEARSCTVAGTISGRSIPKNAAS